MNKTYNVLALHIDKKQEFKDRIIDVIDKFQA